MFTTSAFGYQRTARVPHDTFLEAGQLLPHQHQFLPLQSSFLLGAYALPSTEGRTGDCPVSDLPLLNTAKLLVPAVHDYGH